MKPLPGKLDFKYTTLTDKIVYGGASGIDLLCPPGLFTTELTLQLKANLTSTAATPKEDALLKLIKGIQIKGASTTYLDLTSPIALASLLKAQNQIMQVDTIATSGTADYYAILLFHFGINQVSDKLDYSVVLPDFSYTSALRLEVQWGKAEDLGTGITINSAEIEISQASLNLTPEQVSVAFPNEVRTPKITTEVADLSTLQTNFSARWNPPVKTLLHKTIIGTTNSIGEMSNTELSEIGVYYNTESSTLVKLPFTVANYRTAVENELLSIPKGVVSIGWGDIYLGTQKVGLNTKPLATGEIQIAGTVVKTGGKIYLVHIGIAKAE